jgi:glycosyltransferase 2 family protein
VSEKSRRWLRVVRILAGLACVLLIAWRVDIRSALGRLTHLDGRFIGAFLALSLPLYLLCAWRWKFTASRVGAPLGFRRAFLDYYLSTLLNQVLPVGVAGDIVRTARHRGAVGEWGPAARAVILERFAGFAALALFVVASAALWLLRGRDSFVLVGVTALVLPAAAALILRWWASRSQWMQKLAHDGRVALVERGALGFQLAISVAQVTIVLAMFACAARAAGVHIDLTAAMQVIPLVLFAMTVPWAFAGWGVREVSTAALFSLIGVDAAAGIAASVTFGLLSLAAATPGLVVLCLPRGDA